MMQPRQQNDMRRPFQPAQPRPVGRIDQHAIEGQPFQRRGIVMDLDIAGSGAAQPFDDRRKSRAIGIIGMHLPGIVHVGCKRQRLAAAARAIVQYLIAGLGIRRRRRDLGAGILHLDPAF